MKSDPQRYFHWSTASTSKIVRKYEDKYNRISEILDDSPEILECAATDLRRLSTGGRRGRKATYTAENLLRAIIVHQVERTSLRESMVRMSHSLFLQDFLRLGPRAVPDFTLLDRAFNAIMPATWRRINEALTAYALENKSIDPATLRVDTTLVESNIHWPTDSSLLWDGWRTLHRLLTHARAEEPGILESRFHIRKVKKLHLFVTRYATSPSKKRQRAVLKKQKAFLGQVGRILQVATEFASAAREMADFYLCAIGIEIESYLPKVRHVLEVAKRAWIDGELVRAKDRIFSIFEDHTELIKRGRRHKPVEFGHMVLLGQTRERFITQYDVMRKKVPDSQLHETVLALHEKSFGKRPETLVADKGFCPAASVMAELRKKVAVVAIPQRLKDFADESFVALQHFRAGIEGSISVLKRAFGLLRCRYRGFKNFERNVAAGVFCHNLVLLTGPPGR